TSCSIRSPPSPNLFPYTTLFRSYPELRLLERWHALPCVLMAAGLFISGHLLHKWAPFLHTNGWQLLGWGFFVSTVALYHGTFCKIGRAHVCTPSPYDLVCRLLLE